MQRSGQPWSQPRSPLLYLRADRVTRYQTRPTITTADTARQHNVARCHGLIAPMRGTLPPLVKAISARTPLPFGLAFGYVDASTGAANEDAALSQLGDRAGDRRRGEVVMRCQLTS